MICINCNNPNSVFFKGFQRQLSATLTVLIVALSHGISVGWMTPMLYKLQQNDSPLTFRISIEEISWLGSLSNAGGLIGAVLFGFLLDRAGRKICLYILPLPNIFFWIMVFFASNVYYLYLARLVGGITNGGIFLVIPIFVSEIADPRIRGTLGSLPSVLTNVGVLVGNIIASHVPYFIIPPAVLTLPIAIIFLTVCYPETPQFLLRKGHFEKAEDSLKYYKNHKSGSKEGDEQMHAKFLELKDAIESSKNQNEVKFKDICNPRSLKALGTGLIIISINVFCGFFAITNYSTLIFADIKSSLDPNTSTIIIGVVMILGACSATFFVDKYGRKTLMLMSTSGMALGLTAIGAYSYFSYIIDLTYLHLMPVMLVSFIIFSGSIGIVAIVFVLLVEILPSQIRSLGATIFQLILGVLACIPTKMFPYLMTSLGLAGVMWMFAGVSFFGIFFFLFCVRETKGISLDRDDTQN